MLDIRFIRENPELVEQKSLQKNVKIDIKKLLELDDRRRELITRVETLQAEHNKLSKQGAKAEKADIEKARAQKKEINEIQDTLVLADRDFLKLLKKVPNLPTEDVPIGKNESDNVVVRTVGEKKQFDFKPKTHWEIAEPKALVDRERAAKISGSRFVYLKGDLVRLQFALIQLVLNVLGNEQLIEKLITKHKLDISAKPYSPVIPPMMIRTDVYEATGRLNAEETTYKLADDDLWLIASAEHSLCSMYQNEVIDESQLPIRYVGYSTNFRREAGSYGQDTNGIIRLHQFDKLEMEVFSTPETALNEHLLTIALQEHLMQILELPYQVLMKCTADIGNPNARGVDLEVWLPGQNTYKETHTADYMSDYQARDLKTRLRRANGNIELVHTSDATAFAMGRTLAAIIENYQTKDGHIMVPEALKPYMEGKTEI